MKTGRNNRRDILRGDEEKNWMDGIELIIKIHHNVRDLLRIVVNHANKITLNNTNNTYKTYVKLIKH